VKVEQELEKQQLISEVNVRAPLSADLERAAKKLQESKTRELYQQMIIKQLEEQKREWVEAQELIGQNLLFTDHGLG